MANLTITAIDQSKEYGAVLVNGVGYTLFSSSGLQNGETIGSVSVTYSGGHTGNAAVGTYTDAIAISAATGGTFNPANYIITYEPGDLTVTQRSLNITAIDQSKVYGAVLSDGAGYTLFTSSGLQNGETIGSVTVTYSGGHTVNAAVGTYADAIGISAVTGGTFNPDNYSITYEPGDLTVTQKTLSITAEDKTKVYDGLVFPELSYTVIYNGFIAGEDETDLGGTLGFSGTAVTATNAGTYVITPGGLTSTNYNITFIDGELEITTADLIITATDQSKVYGAVLSDGAGYTLFSSSELQNGETIGSVSVTYSGGHTDNAAVGTYIDDIGISAATGGTFNPDNYSITYEFGDLTVTQRSLIITATSQVKVYGNELISGIGYTYFTTDPAELPNSETISSVTVIYTGGHTADAPVGFYEDAIVISDAIGENGFIVSNYDITYKSGNLTVLEEGVTNHIPVAHDDYAVTEYETAVNIDVLANDEGIEDLPLTLTITTFPSQGIATVEGDNTITFTPAAGFDGLVTFVYRVTDVNGEWDEATVHVTVLEEGVTNHIPVAHDDYAVTEYETAVEIDVLANDEGLEDEPIAVTIVIPPTEGIATVDPATNLVTYTPMAGFDGLVTFTYRVTDVHGEWDEATVHVTVLEEGVTNHIPVANDDEVETFMNTPIDIDVLANDTGLEDGLQQIEVIIEPSNGSTYVNVDNTIRYTPNDMFIGTDTFVYRITDIHGESDMATVTVFVLEPLIVAIDDYAEVDKNRSVIIDVLANDQGIDDLEVSISIVIYPIYGYELVNADNTITYTPYLDYIGLDSLTYEVCASSYNCSQAMVRIEVKDVKPEKLIIPEGFSPDGDDINEYFEIIGLEYFGRVTIKVYNRWGNLVYINNNYKNEWDGKANASMSIGKTLPTGTYYYIIEIVDTKERINGNVFLKR